MLGWLSDLFSSSTSGFSDSSDPASAPSASPGSSASIGDSSPCDWTNSWGTNADSSHSTDPTADWGSNSISSSSSFNSFD
jgi:hypothetical protein